MKFFHRLRTQFRKQELDKDLSDEIAFHIEQETEENLAAGMSAEEAHYSAMRKFGGMWGKDPGLIGRHNHKHLMLKLFA